MSPSAVRLGILYLVPILLATWYQGVWWGIAFLVASMLLRIPVELGQQLDATVLSSLVNQGSFAAVAGIAMAAFRSIRRTQAQLEDLVIQDPLTHVLNARAFSDRLGQELRRSAVRQADIVGRMGGDEFAVLMPETASDVAEAAAGRLAKSLRAAFQGNPSVTASIGIVSCTDAGVGPDDVLHKADRAMYEAKSKGKDQAVKVAM